MSELDKHLCNSIPLDGGKKEFVPLNIDKSFNDVVVEFSGIISFAAARLKLYVGRCCC